MIDCELNEYKSEAEENNIQLVKENAAFTQQLAEAQGALEAECTLRELEELFKKVYKIERDEARDYAGWYHRRWKYWEGLAKIYREREHKAQQLIIQEFGYAPVGIVERVERLVADLKAAQNRIYVLQKWLMSWLGDSSSDIEHCPACGYHYPPVNGHDENCALVKSLE